MNLITGIISLVILLGSLVPIIRKPKAFGTSTTFAFFLGLLGGIMSLVNNWNWWWIVPFSFVGIYAIAQIITQVMSSVPAAAFLKKFLPLSTLLSVVLILISAIPGLKTTLAPNLSTAMSGSIWAICGAMLLFALFIGVGLGNIILGVLTAADFIYKNRARLFVALLGIIYASVYFSMSTAQIYAWFTGATQADSLVLWILQLVTLGIGIILAVAFFAATLTNFPDSMSFFTRIKQLFRGSWTKSAFKGLFALALVAGLIYGLVQLGLIQFPTTIGNVITLVIQAICSLAILFGIFRYVINNPRLLSTIKNNIFIRLLFTIIMIIPCLLIYLTQGIMSTGKTAAAAAGKGASFAAKVRVVSPPKMVLMILAVEILLLSSYIFLPMFRKWIYIFTPGADGDLVLKERVAGLQSTILAAQKKFVNDTSVGDTQLSNVDWEKVYADKLYLTDDTHTKALKAYLTGLGYKDDYSALRDNKIISDVLGKPITLGAAVTFIQTKNRLETIMDDTLNLDHLNKKLEALEKEENTSEGSFHSKILNNKPTYINKKTNIGLYENLKSSADNYNYNYGLSSWIFLMAQPPSYGIGYSKFTKVLDYAGKPTIWYNPEINTLKITINAYKQDKSTPYQKTVYKTTKLPLQKWNNIVVNNVGGTLDVFINKKLVASVPNTIPYMSNDAINIGDSPGISGAVANVTYFSQPISQQKISFFYNNLVNKDPPII